jgi:hypothetical protein
MWGFILAVAAGFCTPYAEEPLARPLARWAERHVTLEPGELRLLSFAIVMLIAGVGSALLDSGSAFWVILGGVIGVFAARIVAALRETMDSRSRR